MEILGKDDGGHLSKSLSHSRSFLYDKIEKPYWMGKMSSPSQSLNVWEGEKETVETTNDNDGFVFSALKDFLIPLLPFVGVSVLFGLIFIAKHEVILRKIDSVALSIKLLGVSGYFVYIIVIVMTSFPFAFGYSLAIIMTGITYGFPRGFIPSYIGSVLGAAITFPLDKYFLGDYMYKRIGKMRLTTITRDIVLEHQIKSLMIIKMAPLPFNLLNLIAASIGVSYKNFMITTMITSLELFLSVYVGSTIGEMAHSVSETGLTKYQVVEFSISVLIVISFSVISASIYCNYKKNLERNYHSKGEKEPTFV